MSKNTWFSNMTMNNLKINEMKKRDLLLIILTIFKIVSNFVIFFTIINFFLNITIFFFVAIDFDEFFMTTFSKTKKNFFFSHRQLRDFRSQRCVWAFWKYFEKKLRKQFWIANVTLKKLTTTFEKIFWLHEHYCE